MYLCVCANFTQLIQVAALNWVWFHLINILLYVFEITLYCWSLKNSISLSSIGAFVWLFCTLWCDCDRFDPSIFDLGVCLFAFFNIRSRFFYIHSGLTSTVFDSTNNNTKKILRSNVNIYQLTNCYELNGHCVCFF